MRLILGGVKMDSKIVVRREYLRHIEQQKDSGLSIKKYCEQNNLVVHKFSYYRTYKIKELRPALPVFSKIHIKPPIQNSTKSAGEGKLNFTKIDPVWLAQFINSLQNTR